MIDHLFDIVIARTRNKSNNLRIAWVITHHFALLSDSTHNILIYFYTSSAYFLLDAIEYLFQWMYCRVVVERRFPFFSFCDTYSYLFSSLIQSIHVLFFLLIIIATFFLFLLMTNLLITNIFMLLEITNDLLVFFS